MIQIIENWVAKRSGAYLTIEGELNGQPDQVDQHHRDPVGHALPDRL